MLAKVTLEHPHNIDYGFNEVTGTLKMGYAYADIFGETEYKNGNVHAKIPYTWIKTIEFLH